MFGDTVSNSLGSATYVDGSNLDPFDWAFVETVFGSANILSLIPLGLMVGDAPTGPTVRSWVSKLIEYH